MKKIVCSLLILLLTCSAMGGQLSLGLDALQRSMDLRYETDQRLLFEAKCRPHIRLDGPHAHPEMYLIGLYRFTNPHVLFLGANAGMVTQLNGLEGAMFMNLCMGAQHYFTDSFGLFFNLPLTGVHFWFTGNGQVQVPIFSHPWELVLCFNF